MVDIATDIAKVNFGW